MSPIAWTNSYSPMDSNRDQWSLSMNDEKYPKKKCLWSLFSSFIMKSKDIQKILSSKYEKAEGPTKIFRNLNGAVGLRTLKRWCRMLRDTGSIELSNSPRRSEPKEQSQKWKIACNKTNRFRLEKVQYFEKKHWTNTEKWFRSFHLQKDPWDKAHWPTQRQT